MIPVLPPKQLIMGSGLEERRKGLQRWLRLITRHPIYGTGSMVHCFLTDKTSEHQAHLRDVCGKILDEFSALAEDVVSLVLVKRGCVSLNQK